MTTGVITTLISSAPYGPTLARRISTYASRVALVLALVAASAVAAPRPEPIRVGIYDNRPMVFLDSGGTPAGLQVDILNDIAAQEEWTLDYRFATWQESLDRLERGEIDMLLDIGYSEERAELYDFSAEPIFSTWAQIYTAPGSPLSSLTDLEGRTVAVMREDVHYASLQRLLTDFGIHVQYVEFDDYKDLMQAVEHRRADAGLFSRIAGLQLEGNYGVRRSPIVLDPIQVKIAYPKGRNADIRETIDTHLRRQKRDPLSTYNRAVDKWLGEVISQETPWWLTWVLGGGAAAGLLAMGTNAWLRREVRRKTKELTEKNVDLEREIGYRARIESVIQNSRDRMSAQNRVLMTLARSEAVGRGDLRTALRQITAAAAQTLDIARASVWVLNETQSEIRCICLYIRATNEYSEGTVLSRTDYPAYFRALADNRIIAASDAHTDLRTSEFSASYLGPNGITAMLDAPVRIGQRLAGILCNEHIGPSREWTVEEESFAASLADFVALALEAHERTTAETRLRESEERNRLILEKALDAVIITDQNARVIGWNERAEQTFGYPRDEAMGKPVIKLIVPPALRNAVAQEFLEFRRTSSGTTRREVLAMRKNGEEFFAEFSVSAAVIDDDVVYTAFVRDISEQIRAREMQERLRLIETELELARTIQTSFLPQKFPPFPHRHEFEIYAEMIPAANVGGDFYDFYLLDADHLAFAIGDVSGKGVPGALVMAMTLTSLKASARSCRSVADCLTNLNALLCEENDGAFFVTLFYGVLHIPTGKVTYGSAGHPPPYRISTSETACALEMAGGLILGVFEDAKYTEATVQLQPRDGLLLYTDGVTEAMSEQREFYTERRLEAVLQRADGLAVLPLAKMVVDDVSQFAGNVQRHDDITLLTLRYMP